MNIFDLFARLTLDTSEYEKGLDESEKKASGFGDKLKTAMKVGTAAVAAVGTATAAMAGSFVKGASAVAEHGDEIDKMSQKLGLSAEAYQQWDYVLGQAGADINSMSVGMKTLTNKLDDAKNGSADAQAMFAKLGLSMEDLNSMSREDVFENVIYGFQGMADSTERAALANDLFGRSGQELTPLFNSSVENTKELMQASKDLGMVMSDEAVKSAADYQDALDTLKRTIGGAKNSMLGDFLPAITSVMDGLTALFSGGDGAGKIDEGISGIVQKISEATPKIMQVGSRIVLSLSKAITTNLPLLTSAASEAIITLGTGLVQQLPAIVSAGLEILVSLATGIAENLPTLIPTIVDVVLQIVDTLTNPETIVSIVDAALDIIVALADGLLKALPKLIGAIPQIIGSVITAIVGALPRFIIAGYELLTALIADAPAIIAEVLTFLPTLITEIIAGLLDSIPLIIDAGIELLTAIIDDMPTIIENIIEALPLIITSIVETLVGNAGRIIEAGVKLIVALVDGLIKSIPKLVQAAPQLLKGIVDGITGSLKMIWDVGMDIVRGIWQGISDGLGWIKDKISGWVGNVVGFIKNLFGIKSPSTVMRDQVGKFLALGLGQGFVDEMGNVERMMKNAMPDVAGFVGPMDFSGSGAFGGAYGGSGGTLAEILRLLREIRDKDSDTYLDGEKISRKLAPSMDRRLGQLALQKARGTI